MTRTHRTPTLLALAALIAAAAAWTAPPALAAPDCFGHGGEGDDRCDAVETEESCET